MAQAITKKDIDGEPYPDPLSINFADVRLTKIPTKHQISAGDIAKFWLTTYREYNITQYDDLWLSLNGIPYIGMLELGDVIYKFDINDIINFDKNKIVIENISK